MAQLIVCNVPKDVIRALEQRAARHNRTVEQEHQEILRTALGVRRVHLATLLAAIPPVGRDEDFAREQAGRARVCGM